MMLTSQTIELNLPLFYSLLTFFSLLVGSLLNVLIYRLPLMLQADFLSECHSLLNLPESPAPSCNLFFPRSFCVACKQHIKAIHNIPVLSYLFLHGRCYYCHARISLRYPMIECLTAVTSLYAAWHFGFGLSLLFALLFIWILIVLFFIDLDYQLLPDCLTLSLLWLGLLANTQSLFTSLNTAVYSAIIAYLALWLFVKIFYLITGKVGMGNGDFKLFAAFGAWFGWTQLPLILLMSSISGACLGILYLKITKQSINTAIAYGPFLCVAGFIALFWGQAIIQWYLHLYL